MQIQDLLKLADHTLLTQTASLEEIKTLLADGIKYNVASCCIPSYYVKAAKDFAGGNVKICTVTGFPNGYNETKVKLYETKKALECGADEIDMVINIAALKNKDYRYVLDEIVEIKKVCGDNILKVIIEACLLTEDEKIKMCQIVTESGADFIKTSTGFSTSGATFDDIKLFKANVGANVKIKAAGGISRVEDAQEFVKLGATRLGTSRLVKIAKEMGI